LMTIITSRSSAGISLGSGMLLGPQPRRLRLGLYLPAAWDQVDGSPP
jgi:hypothetical protein